MNKIESMAERTQDHRSGMHGQRDLTGIARGKDCADDKFISEKGACACLKHSAAIRFNRRLRPKMKSYYDLLDPADIDMIPGKPGRQRHLPGALGA